jgi:DNA repair exonuclease SbcCD ATPase subunit
MRIKSIELKGFRAFPQRQSFDLDADAIIVIGSNGQGKTSLFDGVLWALTGKIFRIGKKDEPLVSMYSTSGDASVSLKLQSESGEDFNISRSYDGSSQYIRFETNGQIFQGSSATARLLELLWPDALLTADSESALSQAITRSVYLQQDVVRQFVESDTEQERFNAISELVGIGRVTELQLQLERQKAAWTKATNVLERDAVAVRDRRTTIEGQLLKLAKAPAVENEELEMTWSSWWRDCERFGVRADLSRQPLSPEAPLVLDAALKELSAIKRSRDRRLQSAQALLSDMRSKPETQVPDTSTLEKELETAKRGTQAAREQLEKVRNLASEERRAQVETHEKQEEFRALAKLALRHLDDRCPVCSQSYNREQTKRRLEELVGAPAQEVKLVSADDVSKLAATVETCERTETQANGALQRAEQAVRDYKMFVAERDRRLQELGLVMNDSAFEALQELIKNSSEEITAITTALDVGERLSLMIAQTTEQARKAELERELNALKKQVEQSDHQLLERTKTGDLAGKMLDALREATSEIVEVRLQQIEPLLQRIYARIDPHPAFRVVRFLTTVARGRGHLATVIEDPITQLSSDSPAAVLSSSQMNALAAALFLSFNLGMSSIPLKTAMLDDPLQSLDDVNLLGLIDLLRRTKDQRQLIVSTHDVRFGQLLMRKLRAVSDQQRTRVIELEAWSREGPSVSQYESQRDVAPLRIVA